MHRFLSAVFLSVLGLTAGGALEAADSIRERLNVDADWRFQIGDPVGTEPGTLGYDALKPWLLPTANVLVAKPTARPAGEAPGTGLACTVASFDDRNWRRVDLPHDWAIEQPFDIALPGEGGKLPWHGVAWYRKHLAIPASDRGKRIQLDVDGAMSYAAVWCNGSLVGGWPNGYASWRVDLTPYIQAGGDNVVAIRLDNPEESSRWYPGAGIYRHVWLVKTAPVAIAHWGTTVTTPEVTAASASVRIATTVDNTTAEPSTVIVTQRIQCLDEHGEPGGEAVATVSAPARTVAPGASATIEVTAQVAQPRLWSLEERNRYVVVTTVAVDGAQVDRDTTPFGIRTLAFTADRGFLLNGKHVSVQGVCLHHDLGALGAAFNLRAAERQLEMMQEMGCNALRTTHNPPAPEVLELCDRMGFLVLDEFSDTWIAPKKPNGYAKLFADWSEADVRAMCRRDRNHPSIFMWSIGNEIAEQRAKDGKGVPIADGQGIAIAQRLTDFFHAEDPTRPTTAACNQMAAGFNGFNATLDVMGYNYVSRAYRQFRDQHPQQPLIATETCSTVSSRGEYLFPVTDDKGEPVAGKDKKYGGRIGFHMSSYDLYDTYSIWPVETEFTAQDRNPFVIGEFVWTGFDYLGEPVPFDKDLNRLPAQFGNAGERAAAEAEFRASGKIRTPARSSYFGIVDLAGFKKDRFYLYQSRWNPTVPMAHILPHWTWPERVGQVTPVHVYTSGDEAELFLNGTSLGRRKKGAFEYRLRWDEVVYAPGELVVVAYKDGKPWARDAVQTAGAAAKLALTADRPAIRGDGTDLSFITVTVQDAQGRMVPRTRLPFTCTVEGAGELVATDNGNPTDLTAFRSPTRPTFNGLGMIIVRRMPGATGPLTVRVDADGLQGASTSIALAR